MSDLSNVRLNFVSNSDVAFELKRWLGERRPVLCIDTETEGLHHWEHRIRVCQIGDTETAWTIPWDDWRGLIIEIINAYDGEIVGHNLGFDLRMLNYWGGITISPHRCHDTLIAGHLLAPHEHVGLKPLAGKYIHPMAASLQKLLEDQMSLHNWNWATVPIDLPEYWQYAALDCILTTRLHAQFQPRLDAMGLRSLYEMEMAFMPIINRMITRGALVDLDYCQRKSDAGAVWADNAQLWFASEYGINPGAPQQVVSKLLVDGIQLTKKTKTGTLSVDKDVLEEVALVHPMAHHVLEYRRVTKYKSTYFDAFLALHDHSYLHAGIRQLGAKTGRMSVEDPPLQQLPKRGPMVRDAFTATPETRLITADFDQIEMRVFAEFANEEDMIRKIHEGIDLHTATAQGCYGLGDGPPSKQQRSIAKNANFSKLFGAGVKRFAYTAGIDLATAEEFLRIYTESFPGVARFQAQVEQVARERLNVEGQAYVRAPSGRLHYAEGDKIYTLVNYLIQGTAADVFKRKLIELDSAGLGEWMVLPVHDEIVMDVPIELCTDVAQTTQHVMQDLTSFKVPLTVGVEGPLERWGSKYANWS